MAPESMPLFEANSGLNEAEYSLRRLHLCSLPRYLTVVLGNGCNLDCPHCYQLKNQDNLLQDAETGGALRRELAAFYPYVSTLRIQGGEVFALRGFRELVDDVAASVDRPLISISTNGTLIDQEWAQRFVELPFQSITFSMDGATAGTFERLRRGARFDEVLAAIERVQSWKRRRNSRWPSLDAFFVVMRSNFREIPAFLDLLERLSIDEVAFQLMLVDERNLGREPGLFAEVFEHKEDVRELHGVMAGAAERQGKAFRRISYCGLGPLFSKHGLDASIVDEERRSLYPGSEPDPTATLPEGDSSPDGVPGAWGSSSAGTDAIQLCRNPWSMLQVSENGDVSLCFLSDPIGNLFETPLARLWNSPKAIAQRSEMISGRYASAGCSRMVCSWREGRRCSSGNEQDWRERFRIFRRTVERHLSASGTAGEPELSASLAAVRRILEEKERRVRELEADLAGLWEKNGRLHQAGQAHIDHIEARNRELSARVRQLEDAIAKGPSRARNGPGERRGILRYLRLLR